MQMRKNTKYKRNFTELRNDIAVVLLALLITAAALFFFIKDLTETLIRKDKTPVATVTYRQKTVQRKFLDRAVWDRPFQNSPVYNGDTIRTASASEATLHFAEDNSAVEIGSDTMIQVFVSKDEDEDENAVIDLNEGAVSVQTAGAKMQLHTQTGAVTVEKDSVLYADSSEPETVNLTVEKGEAALVRFDLPAQGSQIENRTEGETDTAAPHAGFAEVLKEGSVLHTVMPVKTDGSAPSNTSAGPNGADERTAEHGTLSVIRPAPKAKILNQNTDGEAVLVSFKWQTSFPKTEPLVFETAPTKNFTHNVQRTSVNGTTELERAFNTGVTYWRLYPVKTGHGQKPAAWGKLTVLAAPPPVPLTPAPASKVLYKETVPPVRFSWTGNDAAVSYLLEAADNAALTNPRFSKIVYSQAVTLDGLTEGRWYWRVTPRYRTGMTGETQSSKTASFSIEKHPTLPAPQALYTQQIADTANSKNLSFSWKNIDEVKNYKLFISRSMDMSNPIVTETVNGNYFEVKNAAQILPAGEYYWAVIGLNQNGEVLTESKPNKLTTTDSAVELRSVFPPDGYTVADTLCQDIRFTWKTNLKTEQRFQVAAGEDFSAPIIDAKAANAGMTGVLLPQGTWYWRIAATDTHGRVTLSTAKKLVVAPPFDKPELIDMGNRVIVISGRTNTFKWTPVKGADYYQIKIKRPYRDATPLYENLFITKTEIELDLENIEDGAYVVTIQGFASATLESSRRYSLAQDRLFTLKHLKPAELLSPADNAEIAGITAMLKPLFLEWKSVEQPVQATLTLKKAGKKGPVLKTANPNFKLRLPPLEAGKYTWHIQAETPEGFDVSAKKAFSFTVQPVPPLAAVVFSSPEKNTVFDANFFKSNRSITFVWNKIKDATGYSVKIYDSKKQTVFETEIPANGQDSDIVWNFENLPLLSRNTFFIEVKAQRRLKDGILFQDGIISNLKFEIKLPASKKPLTDETGALYGK